MKHIVCKNSELNSGEKTSIYIKKKPVIVIKNADNSIGAFLAICPHQGADMTKSHLTFKTVSDEVGTYHICDENEIIRCPWHSFEYSTKDGCTIVESDDKLKLKQYSAYVEDDNIVVEI